MNRHNIPFKLIGTHNKTPRILIKDRKVWLGEKNLVIYEPNSFIGENATKSKKLAVNGLNEILGVLENKLKTSFKINSRYWFKVRRQHYGLMKNAMAIQYNKEGKKLYIKDETGFWFSIDNSFNLLEAETLHPKTSEIDSLGVQNYFNSHKKTRFKVTPEFILETMNGIQKNQVNFSKDMVYYGQQIQSHIKAIQELGKGVRELTKTVKNVKEQKPKQNQKQLSDF